MATFIIENDNCCVKTKYLQGRVKELKITDHRPAEGVENHHKVEGTSFWTRLARTDALIGLSARERERRSRSNNEI